MISKLRETVRLFALYFVVKFRNFKDWLYVLPHYGRHWRYGIVDSLLMVSYFFRNPYRVHKSFLKKRGAKDLYTYGETPLQAATQIARYCHIQKGDCVYELGCGRGRMVFWLHILTGCQVRGIDEVPVFIRRGQRFARWFGFPQVRFQREDFFATDFLGATVIYLYASSLDDAEILRLCQRFRELPKGTKIITVSYPLTDYDTDSFHLEESFSAPFTWGKGRVYLHIRKGNT